MTEKYTIIHEISKKVAEIYSSILLEVVEMIANFEYNENDSESIRKDTSNENI